MSVYKGNRKPFLHRTVDDFSAGRTQGLLHTRILLPHTPRAGKMHISPAALRERIPSCIRLWKKAQMSFQMGAQPRCRGPPIRPRSLERKHEGSPMGAQPRCRCPPIRPRSPERTHEGSPMGAQPRCRGPPIRPRSPERQWEPNPVAAAHPSSHRGPPFV